MLENRRFLDVSLINTDIRYGKPRIAERCPIRRALYRMGFHAPKVPWNGENGHIKLTDPDTKIRYEWTIPGKALIWLIKYDRGELVQPFEFRLDMTKATIVPKSSQGPRGPKKDNPRPKRTYYQEGRLRPITDI